MVPYRLGNSPVLQVDQRSTSHARDLRGGIGCEGAEASGKSAGLRTSSLGSTLAPCRMTDSSCAVDSDRGVPPPAQLGLTQLRVGVDEVEEGEALLGRWCG